MIHKKIRKNTSSFCNEGQTTKNKDEQAIVKFKQTCNGFQVLPKNSLHMVLSTYISIKSLKDL